MRLWHHKLLPFLPDNMLIAQWNELNSIFIKQPKDILINYVYTYSKAHLLVYSKLVLKELRNRGYNINLRPTDAYHKYFEDSNYDRYYIGPEPFPMHHNDRYLIQCFFNLQEKYDRGQRWFTKEIYDKLAGFCSKYID